MILSVSFRSLTTGTPTSGRPHRDGLAVVRYARPRLIFGLARRLEPCLRLGSSPRSLVPAPCPSMLIAARSLGPTPPDHKLSSHAEGRIAGSLWRNAARRSRMVVAAGATIAAWLGAPGADSGSRLGAASRVERILTAPNGSQLHRLTWQSYVSAGRAALGA